MASTHRICCCGPGEQCWILFQKCPCTGGFENDPLVAVMCELLPGARPDLGDVMILSGLLTNEDDPSGNHFFGGCYEVVNAETPVRPPEYQIAVVVFTRQDVEDCIACCDEPGADPIASCCLPDGTCEDIPLSECQDRGGFPDLLGRECAEIECERACCFDDLTCQDVLPTDCEAAGGTVQAEGVVCTDDPCTAASCNSCMVPPCPAGSRQILLPAVEFDPPCLGCVTMPSQLVPANGSGCSAGFWVGDVTCNGGDPSWGNANFDCRAGAGGCNTGDDIWESSATMFAGGGQAAVRYSREGQCPQGTYSFCHVQADGFICQFSSNFGSMAVV